MPPKRFVSGGIDCSLKIWVFKDNKFTVVTKIDKAHEDWIRDVAWSNNIGLMYDTIASCSEDQKVKIWRKKDPAKEEWEAKEKNINTPAWKVNWS